MIILVRQTFHRKLIHALHNRVNQVACSLNLFFNGSPVDATKWRPSTRNSEILVNTLSQFRRFLVEMGLLPQVCVIKRGRNL